MTQTIDRQEATLSRWPFLPITGAVIVAGPLLTLVSELIAPREPEGKSDAEEVRFLLDNADRLTVSWIVGLVAAAALAAGYVLIASRLAGRGRIVGRVAATLGVLGAIGLAGHYAVSLATLDVALEDSTLTAAVAAAEDGRAALATIPLVVLGLNLAIMLICVAAYRARVVPGWVVVLGVLAFVGDFSPTNYNTVLHATFATVAFATIAAGIRRATPTEG
jgi:hypothetical protein